MKPHILPLMPLYLLNRISPSRYLSMQKCALREIWAANGKVPYLLPSSPASKLGIVVHKLIEQANRRELLDEQSMINTWQQEIINIEHGMKKNWLEQHLLPLATYTKNYEVKRRLCYRLVKNMINTKGKNFKKPGLRVEREVWLETRDKKIGGRVDAIFWNAGSVQIIDYKSGPGTCNEDNIVKEEYRQQMKLYAALFYSKNGFWPAKLTIISLSRQEYNVAFDKIECLEMLTQVKSK